MEAKRYLDTQSRNVRADTTSSSVPEKAVIVPGHINSWDVGEGAMDDIFLEGIKITDTSRRVLA